MSKVCELCNKRYATVVYRFYLMGIPAEVSVCPVCAKKLDAVSGRVTEQDFEQMFPNAATRENEMECGKCKTKAEDIENTLYLGCDKCYEEFSDIVEQYVKENCGRKLYQGKVMRRDNSNDQSVFSEENESITKENSAKNDKAKENEKPLSREDIIKDLQEQKKKAIALEDYAKAAELKQKIDNIIASN